MSKHTDKTLIERLKSKTGRYNILSDYYTYLEFKESGLRKKAHEHLNKFIKEIGNSNYELKKSISYLLCELYEHFIEEGYDYIKSDLIPYTLGAAIILPVLKSEADQTVNDVRPYYWISILFAYDGNYIKHFETLNSFESYLLKARQIDPTNQKVIYKLLSQYLDRVYYSTHHLSESKYIGDALEDLVFLDKIRELAEELTDPKYSESIENEIDYYEDLIRDWVEFQKTNQNDFKEYCQKLNRRYQWTTIVYYEEKK